MATFNLSWTPAGDGFSVSQEVEFKAMGDVGWTLHSLVGVDVNSAKITGLLENVVYHIRVSNHCPAGMASVSEVIEIVGLTCPAVLIDESHTAMAFSFNHLGGDVSGYEVELLSSSNVVLDTQSFSSPGTVVSGVFTGLSLSTSYGVRVTVKAQGSQSLHTRVCAVVPFTTDACEPVTNVEAVMV